uniref:Uncharacterized protein n=1 Tax=Cacopsylla melanoneura TaxID=428564 RepID=A0A8D8XH76_9HEMI
MLPPILPTFPLSSTLPILATISSCAFCLSVSFLLLPYLPYVSSPPSSSPILVASCLLLLYLSISPSSIVSLFLFLYLPPYVPSTPFSFASSTGLAWYFSFLFTSSSLVSFLCPCLSCVPSLLSSKLSILL